MDHRKQITEYLDIDLEGEIWCCHRCGIEIFSARDNYKKGCLIYERDPRDVFQPLVEGPYSFSPNPDWVSIIEFYCPGCGVMMENEVLPLGTPVTLDIELDIDRLKQKEQQEE